MKTKSLAIIVISFLLLITQACSNSALESSSSVPDEAITADPAAQPETRSGSDSEQITPTPAAVHMITPAAPGAPEETKQEINTSSTADRKLALGDSFRLGIFERPFTAGDMVYIADTDLLEASISSDEKFFYFLLDLENSAGHPDAHYGVEFDTDLDGRGDILLWVKGNGSSDWTTEGVSVLADANQDVGGARPVVADASSGDGYEHLLFNPQQVGDPDSGWQRADGAQVQLAVIRELIGASSFFWKAWADNGPSDPSLFDYNDSFNEAQAGSPCSGSSVFYPVNALSQVDSTCWIAYNHNPNGFEPGGCYRQPTAQPAKKEAPACPACGTFEMSIECCIACGRDYVWTGIGCRFMPIRR